MARVTLDIDLNRVEGDLEFQVDLDGNRVVDARCIGTLFRGFEQLLIGRAPKDGLVITPRVCGICGTAHLYAAALALERLASLPVTPHATLVRNLCLMAENVQSDLRQSFLFFTPDFVHPRYAGQALSADIEAAFAPLKGRVVRSALTASRKVVELVALFGGQWPHSSYMLPGGITRGATARDIIDCEDIVDQVIEIYERDVIGDSLDNWLALAGGDALIRDLQAREGPNAWLRQFARLRRTSLTLHFMKAHLADLRREVGTPHYLPPAADALDEGEGYGFVQAARGTLGHWLQVSGGRISRYQIVTPTSWNASPRDSAGRHGHWEQSVIGLELADPADPIEIGHIVRSHDPCLVCTVHFVQRGERHRYGV